jgi:hypothetical protein
MFNFLTFIIGKSVFTTIVEFVVQLLLIYIIYKFGKDKAEIWEFISRKLSVFLILETSTQFLTIVNTIYLGLVIPLLIKILIIFIICSPLIILWLALPNLLLKYNQIKNPVESCTNLNSPIHIETTLRIVKTLNKVDKTLVSAI